MNALYAKYFFVSAYRKDFGGLSLQVSFVTLSGLRAIVRRNFRPVIRHTYRWFSTCSDHHRLWRHDTKNLCGNGGGCLMRTGWCADHCAARSRHCQQLFSFLLTHPSSLETTQETSASQSCGGTTSQTATWCSFQDDGRSTWWKRWSSCRSTA